MTYPLNTERLILRPPEPEDLHSLFAIYSDPATHQFNPSGPLLRIDEAQTLLTHWLGHWKDKGYGQWVVVTRQMPDCVVGFGGLDSRNYLDVERLNLGYRFGPQAWGHGYATELARFALGFGFNELRVAEIFAVVRPQHVASIKVLEKIGMRRISTLNDVPGQDESLVYRSVNRV